MGTSAEDWLAKLASAFDVEPYAGFGPPTVDVDASRWATAAHVAKDDLGCGFFDYLSAVEGPVSDGEPHGFWVLAHVAALGVGNVDSVLLRTWVLAERPAVACICGVYAGAGWHERETHEMFGVDFVGHPDLAPLLLPEDFSGHPLRKSFVLTAREEKPWPGAKEPGEST